MVIMIPTAETKVTRNIEEEAMGAKARVEEIVEATIEAQAAITVPSTGRFPLIFNKVKLNFFKYSKV